jgi:hypothetical protein
MYKPPPIHTHVGATSRYRPAPLFRGNPREGKWAAICVFSGVLSALNRVSL